jgi:hypothetical protein
MSAVMTELSGAAAGKGKAAVITKVVSRLLKNNANNSTQTSENHNIQCNSIGRQAYEVRKQLREKQI